MTGNISRRKMIGQTTALGSLALCPNIINAQSGHGLQQNESAPMTSSNAPISIQTVTLAVNDLKVMSDFYQGALGFELLAQDGETRTLGASDTPLLILQKDTAARQHPFEAGLFHNAFLMPDRGELASWLRHAEARQLRLTGAADHDVSEAIYLNDPEGNGIEVYADRPSNVWEKAADGQIKMGSQRLDVSDLLAHDHTPWNGAPQKTVIGHVHLQVGNTDLLHDFMTQDLHQDLMLAETGAGFYSTGGYHHHFAGNIWNSNNAGYRSPNSTGLVEITLAVDPSSPIDQSIVDPWGNRFTTTPQKPA